VKIEAIDGAAKALTNMDGFTGVILFFDGERDAEGRKRFAVCHAPGADREELADLASSYAMATLDEIDAESGSPVESGCDATG
jgi:hypothetical protein